MKTYLEYLPDQNFLLPPSLREWLPEDHPALFVSDVVDHLDLSQIFAYYERGDGRGAPPEHPRMMVKLLSYGYIIGKRSSRKLERATYDEVPFRVLAANRHPDHDTIANFRKRHLQALDGFFNQILQMAAELGLVRLGHVALDGTKVKANASKHKAMSYQRMQETEVRLKAEVAAMLAEAERVDAEEDAKYGKGKRGDELPKEIKRRDDRLKKIAEAKAALEQMAKERAEAEAAEIQAKLDERARQETETGKKPGGRAPEVPDPKEAKPDPKAQRNFTDPDSRIMLDGATKGFEQAYNAQAAADAGQFIVVADVTQQANDKRQAVPMMQQVRENMGHMPDKLSMDCGFYSEAVVTHPELAGVDLYAPPDRQKHGKPLLNPQGAMLSVPDRMRQKLASAAGREVYRMRKAMIEPVFGQIKQCMGFRRFSFRGFENVRAEWRFVCAMHNLMKIFRSGKRPARLAAA